MLRPQKPLPVPQLAATSSPVYHETVPLPPMLPYQFFIALHPSIHLEPKPKKKNKIYIRLHPQYSISLRETCKKASSFLHLLYFTPQSRARYFALTLYVHRGRPRPLLHLVTFIDLQRRLSYRETHGRAPRRVSRASRRDSHISHPYFRLTKRVPPSAGRGWGRWGRQGAKNTWRYSEICKTTGVPRQVYACHHPLTQLGQWRLLPVLIYDPSPSSSHPGDAPRGG